MFLRNAWYCAALSHQIGAEPQGRIFLNEPVVLFRTAKGKAVAMEDRCCHRRAPLSKGKVEGSNIRCGYHGFLYDMTGQVVWVPGQDKVPPNARVRVYPLVEKHGWAWIWMGDPALADPAKAPAFHWYDDPSWACSGDCLPMRGNNMLLIDNLLDLSHLPFLHPSTVGSQGDTNPELHWERGRDFVRGTRSTYNLPPSPRFAKEGITFNTDRIQVMTYTPPANVAIEITVTEAGKTPGDPTDRANRHIIILNSITPETETSSHYFWGNGRDFMIGDKEQTLATHRMIESTFHEDIGIIEAEQRIIDLAPGAPQIDVMGDTGGLQARRLLERLLNEESTGASRAAAE
jgi:vanillate O-demethylase monooxygenase subunit